MDATACSLNAYKLSVSNPRKLLKLLVLSVYASYCFWWWLTVRDIADREFKWISPHINIQQKNLGPLHRLSIHFTISGSKSWFTKKYAPRNLALNVLIRKCKSRRNEMYCACHPLSHNLRLGPRRFRGLIWICKISAEEFLHRQWHSLTFDWKSSCDFRVAL